MRKILCTGFIAGMIGSAVLTFLNWVTNKLNLTQINLITVASDVVLGKTLLKRKGAYQYIVGTIANSLIGGIYGSLLALLMHNPKFSAPAKNARKNFLNSLITGAIFGQIVWLANTYISSQQAPTIIGNQKAKSSLWLFLIHTLYGLTTAVLIKKIQAGAKIKAK